ncbi:MAG: hypothetical protein J6G98_01250 [Bacilli bacterium]|nr:hypothetical protein [Bacilli bacterium]
MSYDEIITKTDELNQNIDLIVNDLHSKISSITDSIKTLKREDSLKYQYELERDYYQILKYNNQIKRFELYKERCKFYKEYLKYIQTNDILNIKRNEYNYIKILQDEVVFFFDSKENELKQRATIQKIVGKEPVAYDMIKELKEDRDHKINWFLKKEFYIDPERIYSLDYLNYDVIEVVNLIYKPKGKKKIA